MTSLLPGSRARPDSGRPAVEPQREHGSGGRSLLLLAPAAGVVAALAPLVVLMALTVVGWFLSDGGAHGAPASALRVGALGWLTGHGSGVSLDGVRLTVLPLGVTLVCAWAIWRCAARVGDVAASHGPDADALADGDRDWTVPLALALFTSGYVICTVVAAVLAGDAATAPSTARAVAGAVLLCLAVGGPALAVWSGRAAIWIGALPATLREGAALARRLLTVWLLGAAVLLLGALLLDLATAANVVSQLGFGIGETALLLLACLLVLPNAVICAGAYLLGPGFAVGVGTLVSPAVTVLGPLPMVPLLAALPADGAAPVWGPWLVGLAPLSAAAVAMWSQRRSPTLRWDDGALRGLVGGVLAGLACGVAAALAGGAAGPGRLAEIGPAALLVTGHAVAAFGVGGILGALLATWWQRRAARGDVEPLAE